MEDLVLNTVPAVLVIALLWLGPNRFPLVVNALLTGILAAAALVRWLQLALRGRRCKQHLSSCKRECFVYWAGSYDFIVEQTQDGGWIQTQKLPYRTVRTVEDVGAYRILHANGQRFVLRKDELSQESIFLRLPLSKLPPPPAPTGKRKHVAYALLYLALFAFFLLLPDKRGGLHAIDAQDRTLPILTACVGFLGAIGCAAMGFHLKEKGYAYKLHLIGGMACAVLIPLISLILFVS